MDSRPYRAFVAFFASALLVLAGLLAAGILPVGAPNHPQPDRLWEIVERHRVTHLGISPTAIRLLKTSDLDWVTRHDLRSLRILGSTGEPWDPESYLWFFRKVGRSRSPVINISGGTELMGCLLVCPPIAEIKTCSFRGPGLGMAVDVVDSEGRSVRGEVGYLVCRAEPERGQSTSRVLDEPLIVVTATGTIVVPAGD